MNLPFPTSTPAPSSPVQPVHVHPIVFPACAITSLINCRLNYQICFLVVSTASRTAGRVEGRNPKSVPALRCHVRSQCRAPDEAPLHCGSPSSLWKKMTQKKTVYEKKRPMFECHRTSSWLLLDVAFSRSLSHPFGFFPSPLL